MIRGWRIWEYCLPVFYVPLTFFEMVRMERGGEALLDAVMLLDL